MRTCAAISTLIVLVVAAALGARAQTVPSPASVEAALEAKTAKVRPGLRGTSEPLDPEARTAVRQVFEAYELGRKRTDPYAEIGRALRDLRLALRETVARAESTEGAEGAKRVDAASKRVRALVAQLRASGGGGPGLDQRVALISSRVDQLTVRTADLSGATDPALRRSLATALLDELEGGQPQSDSPFPDASRTSAFRLAVPEVQQ
jgi:hypothetical protein